MTENKTAAMRAIEKAFGSVEAGEAPIGIVKTGSEALDAALRIGGFPRGRLTEIHGAKGIGKTTIALHAIATTQKAGGTAAIVDVDKSFDPSLATAIGVDLGSLLVAQPDDGAQALEVIEILVREAGLDLLVVDSVRGLGPEEVVTPEDGLAARRVSIGLRQITSVVFRTSTAILVLAPTSQKAWGELSAGGNALKFYSSVRISARRLGRVEGGKAVDLKVLKNKLAPPFTSATILVLDGIGVRDADVEISG